MNTATSRDWPTFGIFSGALVLLAAYATAAIAGWVDWAAWLPAVLSAGFVAWSAAIRIKRVA
jgi:hypothetical protein